MDTHQVIISGTEYLCTASVRDDEKIRVSFNALAEKTFGLTFEPWYKSGYWPDNYIPYALVLNGAVVANASVSVMDMAYDGAQKRCVQLGTVMTEEALRGQGLSKYLLRMILSEWAPKSDEIFLFANDGVLDFYPKFGFVKADEYQFTFLPAAGRGQSVRKLDLSDEKSLHLLLDKARIGNSFSRLQLRSVDGMLMFYCGAFLKDCVYYCEPLQAVLVAEIQEDGILCYDIFGDVSASLSEVLSSLTGGAAMPVKLGFTPKNTEGLHRSLLVEDDTTLFMLHQKENLFAENSLMFPLLSHA